MSCLVIELIWEGLLHFNADSSHDLHFTLKAACILGNICTTKYDRCILR